MLSKIAAIALLAAVALWPAPAASQLPPAAGTRPARSPAVAFLGTAAFVYSAPVTPLRVLRGFAPPANRYGAGHLGVDLRLATGAAARSAADGVISFAGPVAGRGVVVVQHRDGISTEYEPVHPIVRVGAAVSRGQPIGELQGRHPGCGADCLHWGARRGQNYLDPLSLLRPLGPVVLLPWPRDG